MTAQNVLEKAQNNNHVEEPETVGCNYEGVIYPLFFPEEPGLHLNNIKHMKCRKTDTFICSYPKSGTHWVMEIVSMLKRASSKHSNTYNFLDVVPKSDIDHVTEPRVFATHLRYDRLPVQAKTKRCKVCYCLRNPKDLLVSLYNFTTQNTFDRHPCKWEEFVQNFLKGNVLYSSWFDHVLSWEKVKGRTDDRTILFIFYEDLKKNIHKEIHRIAEFLETDTDDYLIKSIVENTNIRRMREHRFAYFPHPAEMLDPKHSEILFRKGDVGDYKNWFTSEQEKLLDAVYDVKMKESKLTFTYQL